MSHSVATLQAESPAVSIAKSTRPSVSYTVTAAHSADAMKPEILRLMFGIIGPTNSRHTVPITAGSSRQKTKRQSVSPH